MTEEIGRRVRDRIRTIHPSVKQEDIAARVGIAPDAFSRALSGKRGFAAIELAKLAEILKTSMYWLTTGEKDPFEPRLMARHRFDQTTSHRAADWVAGSQEIDNIRLAYAQVIPRPTRACAVHSAADAREVLGDAFVFDFAERIETRFDIDVVRVSGVPTAVAMQIANRSLIVVGETGNWFYQNWSLAHELGHLLSAHLTVTREPDAAPDDTEAQEAEANAFAAELLLPAEELSAIDWSSLSPESLASLVWGWGVSTDALARRLRSLRIEVPGVISQLLAEPTQRLLRRHWSGNVGTRDQITQRMERAASRRFPIDLQGAHVEAIAAGVAPKATLAWMLGVDQTELEVEEPHFAAQSVASLDELANDLGLIEPS